MRPDIAKIHDVTGTIVNSLHTAIFSPCEKILSGSYNGYLLFPELKK